jgi:hypothetical protein
MTEVLELWSFAKGSADDEYFFGQKRKPSLLGDGFFFLAPVGLARLS